MVTHDRLSRTGLRLPTRPEAARITAFKKRSQPRRRQPSIKAAGRVGGISKQLEPAIVNYHSRGEPDGEKPPDHLKDTKVGAPTPRRLQRKTLVVTKMQVMR